MRKYLEKLLRDGLCFLLCLKLGSSYFTVERDKEDVVYPRIKDDGERRQFCSEINGTSTSMVPNVCMCGVRTGTFTSNESGRLQCSNQGKKESVFCVTKGRNPTPCVAEADDFLIRVAVPNIETISCGRYYFWNIENQTAETWTDSDSPRFWRGTWIDFTQIAASYFRIFKSKKENFLHIVGFLYTKGWQGQLIKISCDKTEIIFKIKGRIAYPYFFQLFRPNVPEKLAPYRPYRPDGPYRPNLGEIVLIFTAIVVIVIVVLIIRQDVAHRSNTRITTSLMSDYDSVLGDIITISTESTDNMQKSAD